MTRTATQDGMSKFQRYRQRQAQQGMKLLRVWVPDPFAPAFAAEAKRQALLLRGATDTTFITQGSARLTRFIRPRDLDPALGPEED